MDEHRSREVTQLGDVLVQVAGLFGVDQDSWNLRNARGMGRHGEEGCRRGPGRERARSVAGEGDQENPGARESRWSCLLMELKLGLRVEWRRKCALAANSRQAGASSAHPSAFSLSRPRPACDLHTQTFLRDTDQLLSCLRIPTSTQTTPPLAPRLAAWSTSI